MSVINVLIAFPSRVISFYKEVIARRLIYVFPSFQIALL